LLKWAREEKKCEWDEWTINTATCNGNLEMLKYCFANDCPRDKKVSYVQTARSGNLDYLCFLFDEVKPSRETVKDAAKMAAQEGHLDILKYFVEERKISDLFKDECLGQSLAFGRLDCIKYLVEEAKVPLDDWRHIALARYDEKTECLHYLREKGCPEPTDEEYALLATSYDVLISRQKETQRTRRLT